MKNSSLVDYTKKSPNHSGKRTHSVDRISPHCVVGQCSVETLGNIFASKSRKASCNYGIGADGRVALIVDEDNRSWCSSSSANDQRAITIECASDTTAPYAFNDVVYEKLVYLCVDICKRYEKTKLLWISDKNEALAYEPAADEMLLTVHRWFKKKSCPGDWMMARMDDLAAQVTARLQGNTTAETSADALYRVQVGAYKNQDNAKKQLEAVKAAGFDTYMVTVGGYFKIQVGAFKNKDNAEAMMNKLKKAGFDAFITTEAGQAVNVAAKKSIQEIAKEVIDGKWGSGKARKQLLTEAGYDYNAVQALVNKMLG